MARNDDDAVRDLIGDAPTSDGRARPNRRTRDDDITDSRKTLAAGQLRAFIERIERLEEDKKTVADDIKEVYAEMKGTGFDTKAVRTIIRLRKKHQAERQEEEAILDLYMSALGMT